MLRTMFILTISNGRGSGIKSPLFKLSVKQITLKGELNPLPMICANLLANQIFIHSDGHATHYRATMSNSTHILRDFRSMERVICGNVESDGNTAADALMCPMGPPPPLLSVGFHG